MAKFHGIVGFVETEELPPTSGVYVGKKTERSYFGETLRTSVKAQTSEGIHDNVVIGNRLSIMADNYAFAHMFEIKYVNWMGENWEVNFVDVERPRLILTLGTVYNG